MPIISEKSERSRRGSLRWLIVIVSVLLGLLLVLPLVAFAIPVTMHVGDRWLYVHTEWNASPSLPLSVQRWDGDSGFYHLTLYPVTPDLVSTSDYHELWVNWGRRRYGIQWFRGHRGSS